MRVIGLLSVGAVMLFCGLSTANAQIPRPPASQVEAIDKLAHWVGEWVGTGWAMAGADARMEFSITESVQRKIHGSVLLVEGRGTIQQEDGQELVTHEALAVLSFDPSAEEYRFRTYDLRGVERNTHFHVTENGAEWGFRDDQAGGLLRFTIEIDDERWHEIGEFSPDNGTTWYLMLEMTLSRKSGSAAP